MTRPTTASPRNSSDSLSTTPPVTSSCARDRCVRACSSSVRSTKRWPMRASSAAKPSPWLGSSPRVAGSSRRLSTSRRAASATAAGTATAMSSPPVDVDGTIAQTLSGETIASKPCAWSRPRTIEASTADRVRKTTAGSIMRASPSPRPPAPRLRSSRRSASCRRADRRSRRGPRRRGRCARAGRPIPARRAPRRARAAAPR